jgi:hypothetical protein
MALCRDVNFLDYGSDTLGLTKSAAAELSSLKGFNGPRVNGAVTPQTLFRGFTAGDALGPYVSQFLLKPFAYGPYAMNGTMAMVTAGLDCMTDQPSWLAVQNGQGPFVHRALRPEAYGGLVHMTATGKARVPAR